MDSKRDRCFFMSILCVDALILTAGMIGFASFPFDQQKAERQDWFASNCLDAQGSDNGRCKVEPAGLHTFVGYGFQQIYDTIASALQG